MMLFLREKMRKWTYFINAAISLMGIVEKEKKTDIYEFPEYGETVTVAILAPLEGYYE